MRIVSFFLLFLALSPGHACAGTAAERQVLNAAAPHTIFPTGGRKVKVHYVKLSGGLSQADHTIFLNDLQKKIALCVELNRKLGRTTRPPSEYPDRLVRTVHYGYYAHNRSIVFTRSYTAGMKEDCSLREQERFTADLQSLEARKCHMRLTEKTAAGPCPADGHANAPAYPRVKQSPAEMQAQLDAMAADPRLAAVAAQTRAMIAKLPKVTGQTKTILGIPCEVVPNLVGGSGCVSRAGSFEPGGAAAGGGIMMEVIGPSGPVSIAVDAKFDMDIGEDIFVPYRSGGFSIRPNAR